MNMISVQAQSTQCQSAFAKVNPIPSKLHRMIRHLFRRHRIRAQSLRIDANDHRPLIAAERRRRGDALQCRKYGAHAEERQVLDLGHAAGLARNRTATSPIPGSRRCAEPAPRRHHGAPARCRPGARTRVEIRHRFQRLQHQRRITRRHPSPQPANRVGDLGLRHLGLARRPDERMRRRAHLERARRRRADREARQQEADPEAPGPHQERDGQRRTERLAMSRIAAVVLAAGESTRFGAPKQKLLLPLVPEE